MATACIQKKEGKAYCDADIQSNAYAFGNPDHAYYHYDRNKARDKNPNRLWACQKCIEAIAKDKKASESTTLTSLIGAQGGTK